jgi:protein involved in polysaccharide export with SLBB domain
VDFTPGLKLSALLSANPPTPAADLRTVRIARVGGEMLTVDVSPNAQGPASDVELQPGDQVYLYRQPAGAAVLILGAVKTPQALPHMAGMKLSEALLKAGGFQPSADPALIRITRHATGIVETVNLAAPGTDAALEPADQVFVPQASGQVYVLVEGAVQKPGLQQWREGLTLTKVLQAAAPVPKARLNRVSVTRRENPAKAVRFTVDIRGILAGKNPDFALKGGDVIEVSGAARKKGLGGVLQNATTVLGLLFLTGL